MKLMKQQSLSEAGFLPKVNADLKYALGSRVQMRTKDKLKQAAKAHMDTLAQHPERVRLYFNDPKVKYAA